MGFESGFESLINGLGIDSDIFLGFRISDPALVKIFACLDGDGGVDESDERGGQPDVGGGAPVERAGRPDDVRDQPAAAHQWRLPKHK